MKADDLTEPRVGQTRSSRRGVYLLLTPFDHDGWTCLVLWSDSIADTQLIELPSDWLEELELLY